MHACGGARNRRQETNVLIVSILPAVVVNLALRSNAQGRIKVAGMRKTFFSSTLGLEVPALSSLPRHLNQPTAKCGCKKFLLDLHGDHVSTRAPPHACTASFSVFCFYRPLQ